MSQLKATTVFVLALLLQVNLFAQEQKWTFSHESNVEWTKITDAGVLLLGTSKFELIGLDAVSGTKLWQSDFMDRAKSLKGPDMKKLGAKAAFDQSISLLEDNEVPEISNFAEIKYTDGMNTNYAILNIKTGEIVISPEKAGMPITKVLGKEMATFNYTGTAYIPELRQVIISCGYIDYAQKDKPYVMLTKMIELPSGKELWSTSSIAINAFPFVMKNNDIVLAGGSKIARVDSKTGKVKWEYNTEDAKTVFASFDFSIDLKSGYFFEKRKNSGFLSAIDLMSGKKIWEKEMKLKELPTLAAMGYGVIIIDEKYLTLYDLNSGAQKWAAKKVLGTVVDLGSNGIAVASKGKYLVLLDKETGKVKWEEKIPGIQIDQIAAKGIMYSDIKGRLGLIQYDGQKVWDKKGMLEVPTLRYKPSFAKEIMYIDGDLYEVDLFVGDYKLLKKDIDKEFGGDEAPSNLELVDGGYLLTSNQNMMMLETDGTVRWSKYYEAPGMSLAAKIALRTMQVAMYAAAADASMKSGMSKTPYGGETYQSKQYAQQAESWAAIGGAVGAIASQTFSATVSKGDYNLMLAVVGEGGQSKGSGLVKINRKTGEEVGKLQLGDKEPIYDYDAVNELLFFKADDKQVITYKF